MTPTTTSTTTSTSTTISATTKSALLDQLNSSSSPVVKQEADAQKPLVKQEKDDSKPLIPITVQNINASNNQDASGADVKLSVPSSLPAMTFNQSQSQGLLATSQGMVIASTNTSNAVIRIGNCDTVQTSTLPFLLTTNTALGQTTQLQQVSLAAGAVNQNSLPTLQVSQLGEQGKHLRPPLLLIHSCLLTDAALAAREHDSTMCFHFVRTLRWTRTNSIRHPAATLTSWC